MPGCFRNFWEHLCDYVLYTVLYEYSVTLGIAQTKGLYSSKTVIVL